VFTRGGPGLGSQRTGLVLVLGGSNLPLGLVGGNNGDLTLSDFDCLRASLRGENAQLGWMSGKSRQLAGSMTTHTEVYVELDGHKFRSHCLANGPTVFFPWGPLSSDRLGECAGRIGGEFECL